MAKAKEVAALLAAVDDLLRIDDEAGLFDEPGASWDDGDGYIDSDFPSASEELKAVIERLRALRAEVRAQEW